MRTHQKNQTPRGALHVHNSSEEPIRPVIESQEPLLAPKEDGQTSEESKSFGCKLFVEGLPYDHDESIEAEVTQLCKERKVGGIIRLVKKRGYGFGYLVFKNEYFAALALRRLGSNGTIHHTPQKNMIHLHGRYLRFEAPKAPSKQARSMDPTKKNMSLLHAQQLLLMNLPRGVNDEIVDNVLEDELPSDLYRTVEGVRILKHHKAFLDFSCVEHAVNVLKHFQAQQLFIMGHAIEVHRPFAPGEYHRRQQAPSGEPTSTPSTSQSNSTREPERPHPVDELARTSNPMVNEQLHVHHVDTSPSAPLDQVPHRPTSRNMAATRIALIGGLSRTTTSTELQEYLTDHLHCVPDSVTLILSNVTLTPTGLARVRFRKSEDVERAVQKLNGKRVPWGGSSEGVFIVEPDVSCEIKKVAHQDGNRKMKKITSRPRLQKKPNIADTSAIHLRGVNKQSARARDRVQRKQKINAQRKLSSTASKAS